MQENEDTEYLYSTQHPGNNTITNDVMLKTVPNGSSQKGAIPRTPIRNGHVERDRRNSDSEPFETGYNFAFPIKYDDEVENELYPEALMVAVSRHDRVERHTIQKSGSNLASCLLCSVELGNARVSKKAIIDHVVGNKHFKLAVSKENLTSLDKYHDTFLCLEAPYQSHQVYFLPNKFQLRCCLCRLNLAHVLVQAHIDSRQHKDKIMKMYTTGVCHYSLLNQQVECYGISKADVEKKEQELKAAKEENNVSKRQGLEPGAVSREPIKHNIIKSVEDVGSSNVLDLLPHRFAEHKELFSDIGNVMTCQLCEINLAKDVNVLKRHILLQTHLAKTTFPPHKYKYFCEICNMKMFDEMKWDRHLVGTDKHDLVPEDRRKIVREYECTTCSTVIYGDELSLSRHLSVGNKRDRRKELTKLPNDVKRLFLSKRSIDTLTKDFTEEANKVMSGNLTEQCCKNLENRISETYAKVKAYPFGSRISGLGNFKSDLDVLIDLEGIYHGIDKQDPHSQIMYVKNVEKILRKHKEDFSKVFSIPTARTPIIKMFSICSDFYCDLSFRHGLSVENTKFIRFCIDIQPKIQGMMLLLKEWLCICELNEHMTTYALAMLAIYYLQTKKYLISVNYLKALYPEKIFRIDGWETLDCDKVSKEEVQKHILPCDEHIKDLISKFFQFYTEFDFENLVICPLLARPLPKKLFLDDKENLPDEMRPYKERLNTENAEFFRATSVFCIQDPFDLSHNLTKALQQGHLNRFKTLCDLSLKHLNSLRN